ncbi:hypothetical protein OROMI_012382 [Orobanche minor]
MVVERRKRKPLVLSSTKAILDSLLISRDTTRDADGSHEIALGSSARTLRLTAGILNISKDTTVDSVDGSVLVGLSTSVLKRLSITSGSLILIKNVDANVSRIGQVVVLDPPDQYENTVECGSVCSHAPRTMFKGKETLSCFFYVKANGEVNGKEDEPPSITLELQSWTKLPAYASHLRASFVKIPECGNLERLKTSSLDEAKDRQELIDIALNDYFSVDRYLSRGDLFGICINWNCKSEMCVHCNQKMLNAGDDTIYFKVAAMEPSEEPVLRVNRSQTALVLGGGVPSAVPPEPLIPRVKSFSPVQEDAVLALASILAPTLCPSAFSSKFRVAVLLHGVPGCGKRTVIRYAARHLGLHVVEYSCHSFMTSSEKKTSIALAEAFNTAGRYHPTILLLRHFEVFRNLAAQEGSSHEQVGVSSEVASVIKQFTEPVTNDEDDHVEENLLGDSELKVIETIHQHPILLVAAADNLEGLPPTIRRCFTHEIKMEALNEEQRSQLLSQSFQHVSDLLPNISTEDLVKDMVGQTSGFTPRDMRALIADAGSNLLPKSEKLDPEKSKHCSFDSNLIDGSSEKSDAPVDVGKENLMKALERSKKRNASGLGTPKVPNVKWEDVGGLDDVKKSILDTIQSCHRNPSVEERYFRAVMIHYYIGSFLSCIKIYFHLGCVNDQGFFFMVLRAPENLLAKAVATECSLNFLSVKGPELINMYIGESEKNVRDIFQKARAARPCVIFFDELDSLAPARGASGDSGGVMDRVVSQMLAEIDGLNDSTQDLFIIGASNRPDLIDPALLRPGRFDKLLYVGVNSEASYRERVLIALTRKFKLHEDVSLYEIAQICPTNFTGADMYALCADAWFRAAKRKVSYEDLESCSPDKSNTIVVEYEDFIEVLRELSPSLSMTELKRYEMLRDQIQGSSK